jgi:hypothetical protein
VRRIAIAAATLALSAARAAAQPADSASTFIRINQLGYLPDAPKVAVVCSLAAESLATFTVRDSAGRTVLGPLRARPTGAFGPCASTHRLDFGALRRPGTYRISAGTVQSPPVRVSAHAYDGAADTLLHYMRQQRSGYNPFFRDSVHKLDGLIVDDSARAGQFRMVSGGWADASDYLQYVATSANAAYVMMMAYRDHPRAFADAFDARGLPGANGTPDVLDEARHGLEWLLRMFPADDEMYNQLGDDRDHSFLDLPTTDSSDYGWGRGRERPVYPCTGRPQGCSPRRTAPRGSRPRRGSTRRRSPSARRSGRGATRRSRRGSVRARRPRTRWGAARRACARPRRRARPTSTRRTTGWTTWSSRPPSSTCSRASRATCARPPSTRGRSR